MIKYSIITHFPELFEPFLKSTLLARAVQANKIEVDLVPFRKFAINTHGQVDDAPAGGGGGMLLRPDALVPALEAVRDKNLTSKVVVFTPRGRPLNQKLLREIVKENQQLILLCPRYEGIDERFCESSVDYEISVGDCIYMGGEVPALAFLESSARLVPGVLGNEESIEEESFEMGGLEYPQYTKPRVYRGRHVPETLLSGNHKEIDSYRYAEAVDDTSLRRPDLLPEALDVLSPKLLGRKGLKVSQKPPVYLALIHHPVVDKQGEIITSSVTNLDVHDIARSVRTFNLDGYYIVHPSRTLRRLMEKICLHWSEGRGLEYNPNRSEALAYIKLVAAFDDVLSGIEKEHGVLPRVIATSARPGERTLDYESFRNIIPNIKQPLLFIFGTAWGLHDALVDRAEYRLDPIYGPADYNHLSVRSAVAIILDRLFGE